MFIIFDCNDIIDTATCELVLFSDRMLENVLISHSSYMKVSDSL